MRKVAFYINNATLSSVDCKGITVANPGIGGSEYQFILISYLLMQRHNGLNVKVYTTAEGIFPDSFCYEIVSELTAAVTAAERWGAEYLVFKHEVGHIHERTLANIQTSIKLISWCHIFTNESELDCYAKLSSIYKVINVGREMNDLYRDHPIYEKSTYIYNAVNTEGCRSIAKSHPFAQRKPVITYVGSIVPFKGLHWLAEAWHDIVKEVPDVQLYIIGSGQLYGRDKKLGRFGIAEASYEEILMKYFCQDGRIMDNVHFTGILGEEKNDILLQTKVGIPNPSGISETFGISAVEMQMMGCKVATMQCPGYLDTVKNGILYKNRKRMATTVVRLLKSNDETGYDEAMDYFDQHFSLDAVVSRWETLFLQGDLDTNQSMIHPSYRGKWAKDFLRQVKKFIPTLPTIERILDSIDRRLKRYRFYYPESYATPGKDF